MLFSSSQVLFLRGFFGKYQLPIEQHWAPMPPSCSSTSARILHSLQGEQTHHAELFQPTPLPSLSWLNVALSFEIHLGISILLVVMHPHILWFGLIVSDLPGGVLSLFSVDFFFLFCFALTILERAGGHWGKGSVSCAGGFPNQFIIINLPMLFPPSNLLGSLLDTK